MSSAATADVPFVRRDLSDFLSPMLVKELRQGIRSKVFVGAFLLLQLLMCVSTVISLSAAAAQEGSSGMVDFSAGLFWVMIAIPVLLIMPMSGVNSLSSEMKGNTLDLVFLTRLSALRIVAGKWSAIFSQSVLLVTAVLPYALLRYFLGRIDILQDVQYLGFMLIASALLTGVTVAASPFASKTARFFLVGGAVLALMIFPNFLAFAVFGGGRMGMTGFFSTDLYYVIVFYVPLLLILLLEVGASRIAPPSENHAWRKRVLGALLLLGAPLLFWLNSAWEFAYGVGAIALLFVCLGAVCEEIPAFPSIYVPYVKRGGPGKFAGRLLYPGWPSGALFTFLALLSALYLFVKLNRGSFDSQKILFCVAAYGTVIVPVALIKTFLPNSRTTLGWYLGIQSFMGIITLLATVLGEALKVRTEMLLSVFPTSVLLLTATDFIKPATYQFFSLVTGLVTVVAVVLLFVRVVQAWSGIRKLEKRAEESIAEQSEAEAA